MADGGGISGAADLARLTDLDAAWRTTGHGARLREARRAAERLRDRFASGPRVVAVRTLPLARLIYPTRFAFWGAAGSLAPYVVLTHRALLVQFLQRGELRTLLFNPSDVDTSPATPFLARTASKVPGGLALARLANRDLLPIENQLAALGLAPGDIDYLAFDHFHTQDLRPLLGTSDGGHAARFPRARLIAQRTEWEDWDDLHPMQAAWYQRDGKRGVPLAAVEIVDGDLSLGDGVMLLRTPGHTSGNQTLFVNTESGVWGTSENGTCADAWSALESRVPGVAAACRDAGVDVVLNANTMEYGADQYTSMIVERTIVDRTRRAPAFAQMLPSSEVTPSALSPGLAPTLVHGSIASGTVARPSRRS